MNQTFCVKTTTENRLFPFNMIFIRSHPSRIPHHNSLHKLVHLPHHLPPPLPPLPQSLPLFFRSLAVIHLPFLTSLSPPSTSTNPSRSPPSIQTHKHSNQSRRFTHNDFTVRARRPARSYHEARQLMSAVQSHTLIIASAERTCHLLVENADVRR